MARNVECADALTWLRNQTAPSHDGISMVTSLPDFSEFPDLSLEEWKNWFIQAAALVLSRCSEQGVAVFYQSDIRHEGAWIDKSYLCQKAAEKEGHSLLWHKVVCRAEVGTTTYGKPGFSHLLCFSKGLRTQIGRSSPDVLPEAGPVSWTRGMGMQACLFACRFVREHTSTRTVVDPFCGHGTVLAAANELGLDAIGVDIVRKRVKRARALQFSELSS